MNLSKMLRWLHRRWLGPTTRPRRRPAGRWHIPPCVETLEDRLTPSTINVGPTTGS